MDLYDRTFRFHHSETQIRFTAPDVTLQGTDLYNTLTIFDNNTKDLLPHGSANAVVLEPGEQTKTWDSISRILDAAVAAGIGRDGAFVGVGGGVICDMAAFAASVYLRGIRVVLVPTLLSMVDASIGGKTGINWGGFKNMVGTFYPATEIRLCVEVITSLSQREYLSGMAEIIKHALLGDKSLFTQLKANPKAAISRDPQIIKEGIACSLVVKGTIVEKDLLESGIRAHLNFGHTFGHALESITGFKRLTHGEAVAWGIAQALQFGVYLELTKQTYAEEVADFLRSFGYQVSGLEFDRDKFLGAMRQDKKKRDGKLQFVLQHDICDTFVLKQENETLRAFLETRL